MKMQSVQPVTSHFATKSYRPDYLAPDFLVI